VVAYSLRLLFKGTIKRGYQVCYEGRVQRPISGDKVCSIGRRCLTERGIDRVAEGVHGIVLQVTPVPLKWAHAMIIYYPPNSRFHHERED